MNWLTEIPQPVIFAHRGACAHAPENTLASFRLAAEHGAPAIELDAKLTVDGQVVVFHDQTLKRTTGAEGRINQWKLADLRQLDAGSFYGLQFAGERIPTLDEVFEEVGDRLCVNVELTNYTSTGDDLPEKAAEVVRRHNMQRRVIFSSFAASNLRRVKLALPEAPVGLLALDGLPGWLARSAWGRRTSPENLHPFLRDVTPDLMKREKSWGRRVHVWTVNEPNDMRRLAAMGVDGIFTDDPRLALQVLGVK
ncbi:MAG TPA: glycerophosphodiester phosphodiesterase family protein [Anaerolineaceae bacterium]|nr:glycerophosphodiester phosphodiesterase family protein [Anaerolineaceae bacterium]